MDVNLAMNIAIVVLLIIMGGIFFIQKMRGMSAEEKKAIFNQIIFGIVVLAEQKFGGKTGEIKYAWVVMEFYRIMPVVLKQFVTPFMIGEAIERSVTELKKIFADNPTAEANVLKSE